MQPSKSFGIGVASSMAASVLMSAGSRLLDVQTSLQFVLAVAIVVGLSVVVALLWRGQKQMHREFWRLELASWPGWMRDIGLIARNAGVKVFRSNDSVIFESACGDQHMLVANPAGPQLLAQTFERERVLRALEDWGVSAQRDRGGQHISA